MSKYKNKLLDICASSSLGVVMLGVGLTATTVLILWVFWLVLSMPNQ